MRVLRREVARLLLGVLRKEGPKQKNVKAPGVFLPREELMTYDVDRLVAIHRELIDLGTQLAERRLERRKVPTPVSRLLKLAACDAYEVQALHGQRHLRQALAAAEGRAVRAG